MIIRKIFIYILLLTLWGCGYEPLYLKKSDFHENIQSFEIEGNKNISRKIISSLNLNKQNKKTGYKLIVNSSKKLETVAKNASNNTSVYKSEIIVKISLMDGKKILKEKTFNKYFTYGNIENKFNLSQYQKDIEINLINKIIEEIIVFLTI